MEDKIYKTLLGLLIKYYQEGKNLHQVATAIWLMGRKSLLMESFCTYVLLDNKDKFPNWFKQKFHP